jgi:DNA-binding MarR family transcriptional regulator
MNVIKPADDQELLSYQVSRLQDLINEIVGCCEDKRLYQSQKFNLPYAELKCLMLFRGERYLTVKGMAQKLEVAKSRVTKLVNSLLQKGLVESIEDPKDARVKLISLTPKGLEISAKIEAFQREIHKRILLEFDPEQRRDILAALEYLAMAMETVKAQLT